MALRSNSKLARANLWGYIFRHIDNINCDYEVELKEDKKEVATFIYNTYVEEKKRNACNINRISDYELFTEWASGLAMCGLFDYYYHPQARELVKRILQETEKEANKYSEEEAEKLLTYLIYKEVIKNMEV